MTYSIYLTPLSAFSQQCPLGVASHVRATQRIGRLRSRKRSPWIGSRLRRWDRRRRPGTAVPAGTNSSRFPITPGRCAAFKKSDRSVHLYVTRTHLDNRCGLYCLVRGRGNVLALPTLPLVKWPFPSKDSHGVDRSLCRVAGSCYNTFIFL